jgi:hypothetical protein
MVMVVIEWGIVTTPIPVVVEGVVTYCPIPVVPRVARIAPHRVVEWIYMVAPTIVPW